MVESRLVMDGYATKRVVDAIGTTLSASTFTVKDIQYLSEGTVTHAGRFAIFNQLRAISGATLQLNNNKYIYVNGGNEVLVLYDAELSGSVLSITGNFVNGTTKR